MEFRRRLATLTVTKASSQSHPRNRELPGSSSSASHPLVAGIHDSTNSLLGWTDDATVSVQADLAWIGDGVDLLTRLLEALTVLLQHPQARPPCKMAMPWMERLLDDLVLIADAHACFCEELMSLKQLLAEAQAAVHRRDAPHLAAAMRALRSSDRALSVLASKLRAISNRSSYTSQAKLPAEAVAAATSVAAAASTAIFRRLAYASSALQALTSPTDASPARAMERLRNLEECVVAAEDGCEQVRGALVNTRVSTLNILSGV